MMIMMTTNMIFMKMTRLLTSPISPLFMRRHSSTWRMLKMIKDRVRLSFKKSMSRTSQMEKRKRGKLNVEIRYKDKGDLLSKRADNCQGRRKDKDGHLNRKADLMEKLVRRMQMRASQIA